jgi:acyl-coenzyme A synthetase/AMP-(fatty) acid ligase
VTLPLLRSADPSRPLLWTQGRVMRAGEFMQRATALARALPEAGHLVNLCEHRDRFLIAYCAALLRGHTNLLPQSRAPAVIDEVMALHPDSYVCDDARVDGAAVAGASATQPLAEELVAEIAFTSGSTGGPSAHRKRWRNLLRSTEFNAAAVREHIGARHGSASPWLVATVPPQHMYGTETSVLLPLAADMAVHGGRPLFPADVAAALAEVAEPRVLVTTPVHLRALLASGERLPAMEVVLSATAPLDAALAEAVEGTFSTTLLEMFGATETCVIATRRTARERAWHLYPGVTLVPQADGASVDAPWFDAPTRLQDLVELVAPGRFELKGRNVDLIEVAGKRASLSDLTRRLLAISGVEDAVVFQPDAPGAGIAGVRRVAALVVAPGLTAVQIAEHLNAGIDPAFLPRPLLVVKALPRNAVGKLVRAELLALLHEYEARR